MYKTQSSIRSMGVGGPSYAENDKKAKGSFSQFLSRPLLCTHPPHSYLILQKSEVQLKTHLTPKLPHSKN